MNSSEASIYDRVKNRYLNLKTEWLLDCSFPTAVCYVDESRRDFVSDELVADSRPLVSGNC
jgi:hypothetical protein